ncbi:MAG: TIM barrel protein [Rudaea sp.]|uniref:hydroxypyruvate isomerase family protein n=1 Tax=Rudaea sp. TaxID=2136325 RepID=UPI0039E60844
MSLDTKGSNRRAALGAIAALSAAGVASALRAARSAENAPTTRAPGKLKQSLCRWTSKAPLPELCRRLRAIGFAGVDLVYPDEWQVVTDAGLAVSMGYASRREKFIATGFNDPANHAMLIGELEAAIPLAKKSGVKNLIAMFGNRNPAIADGKAAENCVAGLAKIAPLAAESGVTICVELLNSKVDHPGYQGDHTAFGVAVAKGVGSPAVKLLYDIYHMQIMEGDVIRTIRDNIEWIGHFHTGGVPGRHEIGGTQELNYHAIANAIADLNYNGFVAHEFNATRSDPYASFAEALEICTV